MSAAFRYLSNDPPPIVGREREQSGLGALLDQVANGAGSLVLIGGQAGIGKTALVRDMSRRAAGRGILVLTGHCYDLTVTPPYGPWTQIARLAARVDRFPPPPGALLDEDALRHAPGQEVLFSEFATFLASAAAQQPLMLVLEDLHWSDHESLLFLRQFSHGLTSLPILIVVTYRNDELTPGHELYAMLPILVREAGAHRVNLRPLSETAVRALLADRYELGAGDEAHLAEYLQDRAGGNPFFVGELLRALEEEGRLQTTGHATWTIRSLDHLPVPPLVRQVIDSRLMRLGDTTRMALEVAAVIGQVVPYSLWNAVAGMPERDLTTAVEHAIYAYLLEDMRDGARFRFTHALVREAIYDGLLLPRRLYLHRAVADALMESPGTAPETVAFHLQAANDRRAIEWFTQAGIRAEKVAWLTAAEHFKTALQLMKDFNVEPAQRGWLIVRLVRLLRFSNPDDSLALLEEASECVTSADDPILRAYVTFCRTEVTNYTDTASWERLVTENDATLSIIRHLSDHDRQRLDDLIATGFVVSDRVLFATYASALSQHGRLGESIDLAREIIDRGPDPPAEAPWALAVATALAGDPQTARRHYREAREAFTAIGDYSMAGSTVLSELVLAVLPCQTDDRHERLRLAQEGERLWTLARGSQGNARDLIHLPILVLEGKWEAAIRMLPSVRSRQMVATRRAVFAVTLGHLAQAQGNIDLAWELVRETDDAGTGVSPGRISHFSRALAHLLAASLEIDAADLTAARTWLTIHSDWLDWSGAVLGRAENDLLWATVFRTSGDLAAAREFATRAIEAAGSPRQPLALTRVYRFLGELDTVTSEWKTAMEQLHQSLALCEACGSPYERALTVFALAQLHHRAGQPHDAITLVNDARQVFSALNAVPALERLKVFESNLPIEKQPVRRNIAGLSARERDVLRLVADGLTNAQIAEQLCVSRRTVDQHLRSIYNKLGVSSRAAATRYAVEHRLT